MTIYVLEGPDFAGKTTLAASIRNNIFRQSEGGIDIQIVHNGQPEDGTNLFAEYVRQIMSANDRDLGVSQTHTIFDRLHIGEAVYGPKYRSHSQLSYHQLRSIDELLDDLGAVKIFVDASDKELTDRFRGTRGDDLVDSETELLSIARDYRQRLSPSTEAVHNGLPGWVHWTTQHTAAAGFSRG